jgi:divalent metal cation (Fe/Co/Zn/Cd) transporter
VRATGTANREVYIRRGERLEYFTIGYNTLEGVTSIVAGLIARSVSLVGFGLDSLIEVTSGAALLWRLHHDLNLSRGEQVERAALRTVGACFIALALYILYESGSMLIRHVRPKRSIFGIVIAAISVIVMPLLARAKRRIARQRHVFGGLECTLNAPRNDFAYHWRALRNANTLLSSAPRNSGKRSWTNCTISRR